jgi:microcystin-dependent protein
VVTNEGESAIIGGFISLANLFSGMTVHLFTNEVKAGLTPAEVDALVVADFDEATFPGYAAIAFASGWTTTEGDPTESVNTVRTFTRSSTGAPESVWGYYITNPADTEVWWFEQLDAPVTVEEEDDAVLVTPTITIDDARGNAMPTGSMTLWPVDAAADVPSGWLLCDGSAVSRSTFAELFAVIGTAYGVGDGSTTFELPNMEGRFPLGQAPSGTGVNIGDAGGDIDHVHGLASASSAALVRASDSSGIVRSRLKTVPSYTPTDSRSLGATQANASITQGTELTGDSDTANPPFLTVNYLIKT